MVWNERSEMPKPSSFWPHLRSGSVHHQNGACSWWYLAEVSKFNASAFGPHWWKSDEKWSSDLLPVYRPNTFFVAAEASGHVKPICTLRTLWSLRGSLKETGGKAQTRSQVSFKLAISYHSSDTLQCSSPEGHCAGLSLMAKRRVKPAIRMKSWWRIGNPWLLASCQMNVHKAEGGSALALGCWVFSQTQAINEWEVR